jgi:hypothetical protein
VLVVERDGALLKLKAQDEEDLRVISAQMQDAIVRVGDITYDARRRKFAILCNRFAWDAAPARERRRSGLHFENVTGAKRQGFEQSEADTILSMLSISFVPGDAPSGQVTLTFSAGHAILLDVEYLDCALRDLGAVWSTEKTPSHGA